MITANSVVTIEYSLKDSESNIIDTSRDKEMLTFKMGEHLIFKKAEQALYGKRVSDFIEVQLKPEDAFGEYDDELILQIPRENFGDIVEIKKGMRIHVNSGNNSTIVTVLDYDNKTVMVDANHPHAGKDLRFEMMVVEIKNI